MTRQRYKRISLHGAVGLYTEIARPLMREKGFKCDTCILATRVAVQVMKRLGFPVFALKTRTSVYNPAFVARVQAEDGRFPRDQAESLKWYEEDGSHVIGIDTDSQAHGYPGHLVAIVGGHFLLDSSLDQFSEKSKWLNYEIPGACAFHLPPEADWKVASYGLPEGGAIVYERLPEVDWKKTSDWSIAAPEIEDIISVTTRAIRANARGKSYKIVSHVPDGLVDLGGGII